MTEAFWRDLFAAQFAGRVEVRVPFGRVDVVLQPHGSDSVAVEVEPFHSWRHGVRQALAYAAQLRMRPGLAIFGHLSRDESLKLYLKTRDHVKLYLASDLHWCEVTSRDAASRKHICADRGVRDVQT